VKKTDVIRKMYFLENEDIQDYVKSDSFNNLVKLSKRVYFSLPDSMRQDVDNTLDLIMNETPDEETLIRSLKSNFIDDAPDWCYAYAHELIILFNALIASGKNPTYTFLLVLYLGFVNIYLKKIIISSVSQEFLHFKSIEPQLSADEEKKLEKMRPEEKREFMHEKLSHNGKLLTVDVFKTIIYALALPEESFTNMGGKNKYQYAILLRLGMIILHMLSTITYAVDEIDDNNAKDNEQRDGDYKIKTVNVVKSVTMIKDDKKKK
jgi:hypothetical protein